MREVPAASSPRDQVVYLPHHPVLREGSTTTRLRVVFNASSLTSNGSSLNDHLLAGPKLQTDLLAVVTRWRQFKFVYAADITRMYRQIQLDERDLNYQRILWKNPQNDAVREFQLLTVTYGMACAPYLALRVLKQLTEDDGKQFPLAVPILRRHIYVDDVLFGADDPATIRQTREQLVTLLLRGGFELRKWASNFPSLLSDISDEPHGLACTKSLALTEWGSQGVKILGIGWNPALDVFQFHVSNPDPTSESKRSILSAIAKLFDPLGWVTPVTIKTKIFMQTLWQEKIDWDTKLPESLLQGWKTIRSRLTVLNGLQIPRWTSFRPNVSTVELHGFADASNLAYAAAVYLKVIDSSNQTTITLLAAKSKVAPLTPLSVPRLELSATVLLSRVMSFVQSTLEFSSIPCYCWTDSTVVLAWLNQHPSRWRTFVANRVAAVQSRLPHARWLHVSSEDNPADCASRGLLGDELVSHPLWWHGPPWLVLPQTEWPRVEQCLPESSLEEKIVTSHTYETPLPFDLESRYSSWPKLIRVTSYVFKFIALCRRVSVSCDDNESHGASLVPAELQFARNFWIRRIQAALFPTELRSLTQSQNLPRNSPILDLRPFLDSNGLLRVGGRLAKAPLPFASRHPALLGSHPLVRLLIEHVHQRTLHSGVQLTLSSLRHDYWIVRGRSLVRAVINKCIACARERAAIPTQLMGDLPAVRVSAPSRSFLHCGLDYAGPVQVRVSPGRGSKSRRAYIALFICLATRAVHLELVGDYSTPAFMNAFSRFCSRRGLPQSVYSDNGTNFVGADRELSATYCAALRDSDFQNRTALDNVKWHFIPPSAPHFGGLWEAGVRSVKHHLRRILGTHTLTFEEFSTLLCKIEACLNSRPIAPLSDTLDDYEPLTPGHFLIGSAVTLHPVPSLLDVNENRLTRWQIVRQIAERFWKVWYDDYVNTLQQRSKWRTEQTPMRIGQLVLLRNSLLPPCKWELGRITQCHPGTDGRTRVVTVKTVRSEYKRPIGKVCLLPIDLESTDAQMPSK